MRMICAGTAVTQAAIAERLECSQRTVCRDIEEMRSDWELPIWYNRPGKAWCADAEGCRAKIVEVFGLGDFA